MKLRKIFLASSFLSAAIAVALFLSRGGETEEEKLRQLVEEIADAASRRDAAAIVEHASPAFRSPRGSIGGRDDLKRLLFSVLLRAGWSRVYVFDSSFQRKGETADGVIRFVGAQGDNLPDDVRSLAPTNAQIYQVRAKLLKEDGTWKFIEADYEELSPAGILGK